MAGDKPKWTMERVRDEIYNARTKVFVVAKVLETGSIDPKEHPEWVLVIRPLLNELTEYADKIRALMPDDAEGPTTE